MKLAEPLEFFVLGTPIPKQSVKLNRKTGRWYTPTPMKTWQDSVKIIAQNAMQNSKNTEPTDDNVEVNLYFVLPDRSVKDVGNLEKPICDAMNKVVYADDNQIRHLDVWKIYADETNQAPGVLVIVTNINIPDGLPILPLR